MRWSRLLFIFPAILLFVGYFHHITAYNQDLGRHLLTGEIIIKTLRVPATNLFSYTYPTFPFINHHWGSEVIFFIIKVVSGDLGLFLLSLVLIFSACSLIVFAAQKKAQTLPLVLVALIYLRILFERTDLRPELFSFLFLSAITVILYRYRERRSKLIYLLPVLEILWTNIHIYFPLGVLVTLFFVVDELIAYRKSLFNSHTTVLAGIFIAMGLTTLVNPHFLTGALYPLHVFQNYGYTIEENQTPFFLQSLGFSKPSFLYLEIAIVLLFTSLCISWKKTRPVDWLLSIAFSLIAFSAVRNFPLFVFATFIPCACAFSHTVKPIQEFIKGKAPIWTSSIVLLLIVFTLWQARTVLTFNTFGFGVDMGGKQALDFVERENIRGPIFNNFDIGSYIESRLYPREKVFIDGRPEAYPASFIQNTYIKMQQDPALFNRVANQYHFTTIIFSHTDQTPWAESFMNSIIRNPNWASVYLDPSMIILVKKTGQNQKLVTKFGMQPDTLTMQLPNDEKLIRQAAHFYSVATLPKQLEATLLQLINLNPYDCSSLGALVSYYNQTNNPASQIYEIRYQTQCAH